MLSAGRDVERTVKGQRPPRLWIVLDRLPESHAEREDEADHEHADAPPDCLLTTPQAATFVPLDRRERSHGL